MKNPGRFSKWPILLRKTPLFARQNDSFCATERAILKCKTGHFRSRFFVKKLQGLCVQDFTKSSYFARTRAPDFYFEKMAFTEGKNEGFVLIFQSVKDTCRYGRPLATGLSKVQRLMSVSERKTVFLCVPEHQSQEK